MELQKKIKQFVGNVRAESAAHWNTEDKSSNSYRVILIPEDESESGLAAFESFIKLLEETIVLEKGSLPLGFGNCRILAPESTVRYLGRRFFDLDWRFRPTLSVVPKDILDRLDREGPPEVEIPFTIIIRPKVGRQPNGSLQLELRAVAARSVPCSESVVDVVVPVPSGYNDPNGSFLIRNLLTVIQGFIVDNLAEKSARLLNEDDLRVRADFEATHWLDRDGSARGTLIQKCPNLARAIERGIAILRKHHVLVLNGPVHYAELMARTLGRTILEEDEVEQPGGRRLLQFGNVEDFNTYESHKLVDTIVILRDFLRLTRRVRIPNRKLKAKESEQIGILARQTLPSYLAQVKKNDSYLILISYESKKDWRNVVRTEFENGGEHPLEELLPTFNSHLHSLEELGLELCSASAEELDQFRIISAASNDGNHDN